MSTPGAEIGSLVDLFEWRVGCTPEAVAYAQSDTSAGGWRSWRWREVAARVHGLSAALAQRVAPGERVAILLPNSVEAVCADLAVLGAGGVPVPLHALDNPASIAYILDDSQARVVFTTTQAQWAQIAACGRALASVQQVVTLEAAPEDAAGVPRCDLATFEARGAGAADAPVARPAPGDLAAIVYTSGTTGRPKGVMLSHGNVVANVRAALSRLQPAADDGFLSFLPLSHTFERTAGYYLPMAAGCRVSFARSVQTLVEDLAAVRPSLLVSVPRIYEKAHARLVQQAAESAPRLGPRLLALAIEVGWRRFLRRQGRPAGGPLRAAIDALLWPLLDRRIGQPLRAQFGGRLRLAVSGGAPLALPIARCFLALGIDIVQGYGMTETSPVVCVNTLEDNEPTSVGRPLPGVEVRLGERQELQVRGPSVMRGYWNRPEDTAAAFVDGWLRTGDQAAIEDGRVRILGRIKEIIVTATGEKIAPADVEQAILADPLFEQACVLGEGRPFLACLLVLQARGWRALAASLALDPDDAASLHAPAAREAVMARVTKLTAGLPRHGQPRQAVLTLEPWTVENSLLTPTLKLKRLNLMARFAGQIEHVYGLRTG